MGNSQALLSPFRLLPHIIFFLEKRGLLGGGCFFCICTLLGDCAERFLSEKARVELLQALFTQPIGLFHDLSCITTASKAPPSVCPQKHSLRCLAQEATLSCLSCSAANCHDCRRERCMWSCENLAPGELLDSELLPSRSC